VTVEGRKAVLCSYAFKCSAKTSTLPSAIDQTMSENSERKGREPVAASSVAGCVTAAICRMPCISQRRTVGEKISPRGRTSGNPHGYSSPEIVGHVRSKAPEKSKARLYAGFCAARRRAVAVIPLGRRSRAGSSHLPAASPSRIVGCLFGVAPRRDCPFHPPCLARTRLAGRLVSVALILTSRWTGVTCYAALWSRTFLSQANLPATARRALLRHSSRIGRAARVVHQQPVVAAPRLSAWSSVKAPHGSAACGPVGVAISWYPLAFVFVARPRRS